MKLKALFLALAVAGVGASFGLTDTGRSDTGTTTTTVASPTTTSSTNGDCRRFELHGTLASVSASSFSVNVTEGNDAAKSAVGTAVTIAVSADTRVSWSGSGTLTGPNMGDSVKVHGKQCGTTLTASKVQARGPRHDHGDSGTAEKHGDNHQNDAGTQQTTTNEHSGTHK